MELGEFSLRVLFYHILPSITTVLFTYAFILGVTKLLRIRSPNWLYLLLVIPLLKGLVVLVRGAALLMPLLPTTKPFGLSIRFWDPFGALSVPAALDDPAPLSPFAAAVAIGAISLIVVGLLWRWGALILFYWTLRSGVTLGREDEPRLFNILDGLVAKMGSPYPRVVLTDCPYVLPCTVGLRSPAVVMSPELVEDSTDEEMEAILAHELAHLVRRDHLTHWIVVVVRDVLFFNPLAHVVFSKMILAKEQDCDRLAAQATGKPGVLGRVILNVAAAATQRQLRPLPGNLSTAESFVSRAAATAERIKALLAPSQHGSKTSMALKFLLVILVVFGFLLNVYLGVSFPRIPIQVF